MHAIGVSVGRGRGRRGARLAAMHVGAVSVGRGRGEAEAGERQRQGCGAAGGYACDVSAGRSACCLSGCWWLDFAHDVFTTLSLAPLVCGVAKG